MFIAPISWEAFAGAQMEGTLHFNHRLSAARETNGRVQLVTFSSGVSVEVDSRDRSRRHPLCLATRDRSENSSIERWDYGLMPFARWMSFQTDLSLQDRVDAVCSDHEIYFNRHSA